MFQDNVVIDARGHLLGRLCSIIAKELLNGQQVTLVRTEDINISGKFIRNKRKFLSFLRKRMNTNPRRCGPIHYRSPAKIVWRTIRGMMPYKTARGVAALGRLKVFEGIPPPYDKRKRLLVPDALRVIRLRPDRKYCRLGRIASEVGWRFGSTIEKLEAKRKVHSAAYYKRKKMINKLKVKAEAAADYSKVKDTLTAGGY